MKLLLTVVIPTIKGREQWLEKCQESYRRTLQAEDVWHRCQILVIRDRPSCGIAWNEGIAQSEAQYIHLSADDIEPLDGWLLPAIRSVGRKELPAARILNSDGTLQSCGTNHREAREGTKAEVARIPFASSEQLRAIGPMMEDQYMGDYWFSHRGRQCGFPSKVVRDYAFIHHYAPEGRDEGRMVKDLESYQRLVRQQAR